MTPSRWSISILQLRYDSKNFLEAFAKLFQFSWEDAFYAMNSNMVHYVLSSVQCKQILTTFGFYNRSKSYNTDNYEKKLIHS